MIASYSTVLLEFLDKEKKYEMLALPGLMNTIPTLTTFSCESSFLSLVKLLEASLK